MCLRRFIRRIWRDEKRAENCLFVVQRLSAINFVDEPIILKEDLKLGKSS
jgi:hypothetical protein